MMWFCLSKHQTIKTCSMKTRFEIVEDYTHSLHFVIYCVAFIGIKEAGKQTYFTCDPETKSVKNSKK